MDMFKRFLPHRYIFRTFHLHVHLQYPETRWYNYNTSTILVEITFNTGISQCLSLVDYFAHQVSHSRFARYRWQEVLPLERDSSLSK